LHGDPRWFAPKEQVKGGSATSKRAAGIAVETLEAAGVKRCSGIVGDTPNRVSDAIDRSEVEWVHICSRSSRQGACNV